MDELELRHAEAHYAEMPRDGYSGRCEMLLPEDLRGMRVLDLGCRNGKGACKLADRVGPDGFVLGVDPSAACVARAEATAAAACAEGAAWAERLAFARGCFEDPRAAGVEDASFAVVIVNSVLNLAWDLEGALREAARALAPDGFLYHAGVFADEPLPTAVMQAFACAGNVFGAARSQAEFARIAVDRAGFASCSVERERPVEPDGSDAAEELRGRSFTAAIARARR